MQPIGIIFDMDGVLVDSYRAHLRSWCLLAEEMGAKITEAQFASSFGRTSREIIRDHFKLTDSAKIQRLDDRKEAIYRDLIREHVPEMPGAVAAVRALHAAGFVLGVGSSGPPENVALVCDRLGLRPMLAAIVTAEDVQRGKPDPQVFLLTAERMAVLATYCIVVEDAPVGIEAARRAGMHSIALVGTHPAAALSAADAVVQHLDKLTPELIRQVVGV
jgi:beta-phosphoglucomutase